MRQVGFLFQKSLNFVKKAPFSSTIDPKEITTFSKISDWWDFSGSQQALQAYNYLRTDYIKKILHNEKNIDISIRFPFKGLEVLDVGCGGGLLCESLARFGANVIGIDPTENSIKVAIEHAKKDFELKECLQYELTTSDEFIKKGKKFDLITSVEVIEHVNDQANFLKSLQQLLKPKGVLIMSTFNKTYWAYMLGVVAAEYILGIVPKGTHDWNKFVHPMNLVKEANILGLELVDLQGTEYDPIRNKMNYTKGTDITYLIAFRKKVVEG